MANTLYGIPNCDQVKKARAWLNDHAVDYDFHDFKKSGVAPDLLKTWLQDVDWEVLLNRKGTTWRGLDDSRKAAITDAASAAVLMQESPSVIKRPVLHVDGTTHVGF
ncbi:MAG: ArsC family reductase, partial [Proteobacteria bacterium]|nr:ArsC family reductase [Pseudomonadota bacterium]